MSEKQKSISNAKKFINAYNTIDYSLRTIYNMKRSLSFADAVRKAVNFNSIIRKYEEKLIDYGRLRNSIVHSSNPEIIIAEPHDSVTDEIEKIALLLSMPPLALPLCKQEVIGVEADAKLGEVLKMFYSTTYSNLPVFKNESLIGVANSSKCGRFIGKLLLSDKTFEQIIGGATIEEAISSEVDQDYYQITNAELTADAALNMFFNNRKLTAIIITKNGNFLEKPLGILTTGDIMDLNHILENY